MSAMPKLDPAIEKKIDKLMDSMTLEEKIGQMTQIHGGYPDHDEKARQGKIGSLLALRDPQRFNQLQKYAVESSRLKIPMLLGDDVIHGYRTIFPIPLAESCSWNPDLIENEASIAAKEASAYGIRWSFSPMVDIARDPRWGRIAEGSGEDPYLGSILAAAKVRGFQGNDLTNPEKVAACVKHFVGYGAAEGGRDYNTTEISVDSLWNVYLPPFKAAVEEGAATIMSAFNDLNGFPASGNSYTLTRILRDTWNFQGFVVSDWASIQQMVDHGFAEDDAESAYKALESGVDMDMACNVFPMHLPAAVKGGHVNIEHVDKAVRRILRVKYQLGLFEHPYAPEDRIPTSVMTPEHVQAARQAGRESIVLLKNQGSLLPLAKELGTLAVIGPLADNKPACLGCWIAEGKADEAVTVLEGIKAQVSKRTKVLYAQGCETNSQDETGFAAAVTLASQADAVVLVVGETSDMSGEAHSRAFLDLPGNQQKLVEAIQATGKPLVVVLMNGRPLAIPWIAEHVPAVVEAWQLGSQHGHAVADVLFGAFNPCGRLTTSFPRAVGQVPVHYNHKNSGRPTDLKNPMTVGYIDLPVTPQYCFGHGLSYTTFEYSDLQLSSPTLAIKGTLTISCEVKNTGKKAGVEVAQLYVRDMAGSMTRPVRELKGFVRVSLQPGETLRVHFTIEEQSLGYYHEGIDWAEWLVEPGLFKVWVGPSAAEGLEGSFHMVEK